MKLIIPLLAVSAICSLSCNPLVQNGIYIPDKQITLPGNGGYDLLDIDQANRRLYISHETEVNVIDLETEKSIGVIEHIKGAHGITVASEFNRGFVSDGFANAVVAFDLKTLKTVATIALDGKGADDITYDPYTKKVFAFNPESNNASVIDPATLKQIGSIDLGGAPEFAVSDGKGKVYNNLADKNRMVVIDAATLKVIKNYPLGSCEGPTGIALDKQNGRIFSVCRQSRTLTVIDAKTGRIITTFPIGAGVDAAVYNTKEQMIITANNDGTASVFKQESADKYQLVQVLKTTKGAKTVALDTVTNKLYFSAYDVEKVTLKTIPNTFKVWVYKLQ